MHRSNHSAWRAAAARQSTTIIAYLREHQLLSTELVAALDDVLEKVQSSGNDRGFAELLENLQHMHRCLSEPHFDALRERLDPRDDQALRLRLTQREKALARVIRQGAIVTDDEYRIVLDRVGELSQEEKPASELKRLNEMLAGFDRRVGEAKGG